MICFNPLYIGSNSNKTMDERTTSNEVSIPFISGQIVIATTERNSVETESFNPLYIGSNSNLDTDIQSWTVLGFNPLYIGSNSNGVSDTVNSFLEGVSIPFISGQIVIKESYR